MVILDDTIPHCGREKKEAREFFIHNDNNIFAGSIFYFYDNIGILIGYDSNKFKIALEMQFFEFDYNFNRKEYILKIFGLRLNENYR